ncbi:hypothetical protein ACRPLT_004400 [Citrobacter freundii]
MSKPVVNNKYILQTGMSLGVDVMRSNLPEPLKLVEQAVIDSCHAVGINPEHEINGLSFIGRVMLTVMEKQTGEKFIPEYINDSSRIIFLNKVAAYAVKFGEDKAAKAYSLTPEQVKGIMREAEIDASRLEEETTFRPETH